MTDNLPTSTPDAEQQSEPIVIVTTCDDLEAMSPETREAFVHMVQLAIKAIEEGTLGPNVKPKKPPFDNSRYFGHGVLKASWRMRKDHA